MLRVSSNTSLIAAHVASVSTVINSSTYSRTRRKRLAADLLDRDAVANSPTCASTTRLPAAIERVIASESTG
jgi:hypothetical protein